MPQIDELELKKRNAQELLARGLISPEDYETLGLKHGFVPAPASARATGHAITIATWAGYAALVLGALAEVAAQRYPELKGPLETIAQVAHRVIGSL